MVQVVIASCFVIMLCDVFTAGWKDKGTVTFGMTRLSAQMFTSYSAMTYTGQYSSGFERIQGMQLSDTAKVWTRNWTSLKEPLKW